VRATVKNRIDEINIRKQEKSGKHIRTISVVLAVVIALSVFVGIVPAENENLLINAEAAQNMTGTVTGTRENFIGNTSFGITIRHSKERLEIPEKRTVCTSQEGRDEISLPIISQNNNGLRVSSFSRGAAAGASGVINMSSIVGMNTVDVGKKRELPKTTSSDDIEERLGEEVALGNVLTNGRSRFAEPDLWVGTGADQVPGTTETAYDIANDYKPWLYNRTDQCPDTVYYRVVKGYDPYTEFDAYVIQYFAYWGCQDCFGAWHEYDYEPIFVWVRNIGEIPYRVAYDRMGDLLDSHVHEIHRTHLWTSHPDGYCYFPENTCTNDKSYYPFGNVSYETPGDADMYLETLPTSLQNNWNRTHVRLGIANCWHTFDTDISGSYCEDYTRTPLTDDELIAAYRLELDDTSGRNCCWFCGVEAFKYDISDPFHGVFWTDHYHRRHDFPTVSAAINSAELTMVNGTLSVDTSAYYDNSRAGGSPDMNLTGLWKDRFSAYLEGEGSNIPLEEPFAADERSAGNYVLKFNNLPLGTYNLSVGLSDNINENEYWTEPENKITNEFKDDFEDTDFSLLSCCMVSDQGRLAYKHRQQQLSLDDLSCS